MNISEFNPTTVENFIADNANEMKKLQAIIKNNIVFPGTKSALILHGCYGSGKTALARILPGELERYRNDNFNEESFDGLAFSFYGCSSAGGSQTINSAKPNTVPLGGISRHYIVLDEFDNIRRETQKDLKSFMTQYDHVTYIMTTNHLSKIDAGIKSRSHCISFENPSQILWRQRCRAFLDSCGVKMSDDEIASIVSNANGDARYIRTKLEEYSIQNAS